MRPVGGSYGLQADIRLGFHSLRTHVAAVATEAERSQGIRLSDSELNTRATHAILMELARRHLISYRRMLR